MLPPKPRVVSWRVGCWIKENWYDCRRRSLTVEIPGLPRSQCWKQTLEWAQKLWGSSYRQISAASCLRNLTSQIVERRTRYLTSTVVSRTTPLQGCIILQTTGACLLKRSLWDPLRSAGKIKPLEVVEVLNDRQVITWCARSRDPRLLRSCWLYVSSSRDISNQFRACISDLASSGPGSG